VKDLGGNLVFLDGGVGVFKGLFSQVAEQLTQRLGVVKCFTPSQALDLFQYRLSTEHDKYDVTDVTKMKHFL
jgi:hypothetical protein